DVDIADFLPRSERAGQCAADLRARRIEQQDLVIDGLAECGNEAVRLKTGRRRNTLEAARIRTLARKVSDREALDAEPFVRADALGAVEREEVIRLLGRRVLKHEHTEMAAGSERALRREHEALRLASVDRQLGAGLQTGRGKAVRVVIEDVDRHRRRGAREWPGIVDRDLAHE